VRDLFELDARGEAVTNSRLSARRQIVLTDVYCHLSELDSLTREPSLDLDAFARQLPAWYQRA
jgi:hypothetical protein